MAGIGPRSAETYSSAPVPSNYVAGAGRGATGFTTRSDIGPARPLLDTSTGLPSVPSSSPFFTPQFGAAPAGYVAGRGRAMGALANEQGEMNFKQKTEEVDRGDYSQSNYDEFSGYGEKLFHGTPYEDDDLEADRIYDSVDEKMESRRKRFRELQLLEAKKKNKGERIAIADQFADLKRDLANITAEQWDAIPDVGDHSLKFKQKRRNEVFTPLPDFLIGDKGLAQSVDPSSSNAAQSVTGLAEARGTVLSLKLDKMSDSVTGQTVVDPKGYLTDLNSIKITSEAEIGDIKKARTLLGSVTATNPKHAPGWIASARVEEYAGKIVQARKIIRQGCDSCPDSEDVWLECARLHASNPENAKAIIANAVRNVPQSIKLWLYAAELEKDDLKKKIVLRRALEFNPSSVLLWKTAIELEDVVDARIMLARAVECVPHSVEMWLALAKLETYDNARKVLNQAREAIPTEPAIWITAAKLEEANGHGQIVDKIIEKATASLAQYQVVINRDHWLDEAEAAETTGALLTCNAIVKNVLHIGVDEEDRKRTWIDDAEACMQKTPPYPETARAIFRHCLSVFPKKPSVWMAAAMMEKEHGTSERLQALLGEAVQSCPTAEVLWLMLAKEKWIANDLPAARRILSEAFEANPNSEQIWLAAVKLEWENEEVNRARSLLSKARGRAPTERVYMKSALLERETGDIPAELSLLDEGISLYPSFAKFYMMAGQACSEVLNDFERARHYFQEGIKSCPESVTLWILLAQLEEQSKGAVKARSILERARLKFNNKDEELWLHSIRLERRIPGNEKPAEALMARAIQECPNSGLLWAEDLLTCSKQKQKSKSIDALKRCDNDPLVIVAVARLFEKDRKYVKARKWYDRTVTLSPRLGDAWAYYYAFELRQKSLAKISDANQSFAEDVYSKCITADPNKGELWCSISKRTEYRRKGIAVILVKAAEAIAAMAPTLTLSSSETKEQADDNDMED